MFKCLRSVTEARDSSKVTVKVQFLSGVPFVWYNVLGFLLGGLQ